MNVITNFNKFLLSMFCYNQKLCQDFSIEYFEKFESVGYPRSPSKNRGDSARKVSSFKSAKKNFLIKLE